MSESTNDTTNTITSAPEAATPAVPSEPIPAEDTGAEREQGDAASSDEDELAARRAAVLAGDYSAWSADLSLSEPVTPSEPEEQKPSPEAIEAVQRIARAHGTPAAIGRDIVFHGDGYPVRGVIIGSEGNSLAIRVESGMECLVPPDIQIQYLDTQGRVIWASPDLPDQEQPQQPQAEEPAAEQATGQADPDQAAEQTDSETAEQDQVGQDAHGDEAPATAPQPEGAEDAQDAGQESGLTDEPRDTDPDGETVDQPHDPEPTVQPDGEPADQPQGAERGAETADQVVDRAEHEAEDAGSEQEEPQASEPGAESPEAR